MTTDGDSTWFALYPFGGGGAGSYLTLTPYLGRSYFHVPRLPGRDSRRAEAAATNITSLSDDLWAQLAPELETRPVRSLVLFGYSLGAMMASEMAERIQDRGDRVKALVVGGAASPDRWRGRGVAGSSEEEFLARLRRLGIAPPELLDDPTLRDHYMPVWRADSWVADSIRPRQIRFDCPVLAIAGNRDPLADRLDLESWEASGTVGSQFTQIGGDHGSLIRNPAQLVRLLAHAAAFSEAE
jgi:surfactin synthase thioesterase subunit